METFGQYITKEYGLSKNILGFLSVTDLLTARRVCRDWKKVADLIILNEYNKFPDVNFLDYDETRIAEYDYWDGLNTVPKFILKCISTHRKYMISPIFLAQTDYDLLWKRIYHMDSEDEMDSDDEKKTTYMSRRYARKVQTMDGYFPSIIHIQPTGCFSISDVDGKLDMTHSAFQINGACSLLALPDAPGVTYSMFITSLTVDMRGERDENDFSIEELEEKHDEPVKCVILFENCQCLRRIQQFMRYIIRTIKRQQDTPFAIGGGKAPNLSFWAKDCGSRGYYNRNLFCGLIIRGENVVAVSDIMKEEITTGDMNNFMEQLAERVGPKPADAYRIAFMAQCVDRPHKLREIYEDPETEVELLELSYFFKHFPDTYAWGFEAKGEYGIRADSRHREEENYVPAPKLRRRLVNMEDNVKSYIHWLSTSIVVLTFLKPKK